MLESLLGLYLVICARKKIQNSGNDVINSKINIFHNFQITLVGDEVFIPVLKS